VEFIVLPLSVTNCYLFRNGKKWVLVDTGYAQDWKLFNRRLATAGLQVGQISHLILTHHHDDHVGFVPKLVAQNADIVVTMCALTRGLLLVG
jgi:glyoxylase-like metal-dependent hydrolase (beta-lactamase superfamily II)